MTIPQEPKVDILDPLSSVRGDSQQGQPPAQTTPDWLIALLPWLRGIGLGVAGLALLVLPIVTLLAAKALRRSQRRRQDPETSIVAAWDEYLDELADRRLVGSATGTRQQVAEAIGTETARQLAATTDRAVFGDADPDVSTRDQAWRIVAEQRKALDGETPFWRRLRARLDPTSFLRHLRRTE